MVSGPNVKTVDEFPTEFPSPKKAHYTIAFADAGFKVFVPRRAYFLIDWKFTNGTPL